MSKSYKVNEDKPPSWLGWIGHMPTPAKFLHEKSWASAWAPVKISNSFFRSLGVVAFACNPLTGILIYFGMLVGNPHVAIAGLMAGIIGILFSLLLKADSDTISSGLSCFNSILVGAVLTAVVPAVLGNSLDLTFWVILALAACMTVFVDQGLNQMMSPSKLPGQSVPFNLVAICVFLALQSKGFTATVESTITVDPIQNDTMVLPTDVLNEQINITAVDVDWKKYLEGTIIAAGQIYGVETVRSSLFVWFGFLLYSPLLVVMMFIGSNIGSLIGIFFTPAPYTAVYAGLWGFNSLLACGGMVFFCAATPVGILTALINALIAGVVQVVLTPVFAQSNVPVFSCPFNVAIMLVLAVSLRKGSSLRFVADKTFPEMDLYLHFKKRDQLQDLPFDPEFEQRLPLQKV